MELLRTVAELRQRVRQQRAQGRSIALVPTMGALHAGHASLIRTAAKTGDFVVVTLFVNPRQFGPEEDFSRYPRSLAADLELAAREGAEALFTPTAEEMYPPGSATFVEVEGLSNRLDGKSRPGHFRGVATIVTKLLAAAEPDRAYFGQKDAAQVAVLRRMVRDLCLHSELIVCPIIRDSDGLALSSRNTYLSQEERKQALALGRVVRRVEALVAHGERKAEVLLATARASLAAEPALRIDYVELVNWDTLEPVSTATLGTLFAVAAWIGKTRLIDNTILS